jgi:hypothetical protein
MIDVEIACHTEHLAEVLASLPGTWRVTPGAAGLSVLRARLSDAVHDQVRPVAHQMGLDKKITRMRAGGGDMSEGQRARDEGYPLASLPAEGHSVVKASYTYHTEAPRKPEP